MASEGWKALNDGCGDAVVVAVDFEATGRPEACFSDLVPLLNPQREVWAATQPDTGETAQDYLRYWSDGLRESGRKIHAVLGFCAGGVFAAALAEEIAQWQGSLPQTVVLDPEPPTPGTLVKQFDNALRGLAGIASEAELAAAQQSRMEAVAQASALAALGLRLGELYQQVSEPAFERIGLKADFRADLVASFGALMRYLVAAGEVPLSQGWASATAILSRTPICEPTGVNREVRTTAAHADLLRSTEVARLVSESLG